MGSTLMQPQQQQGQQMLQMSPQMPSAMPPGGGMVMPPPQMQQMPQMGGGKGDMNPLMLLFPGIARGMRNRQMQDMQMSMQMEEIGRAREMDEYNRRKSETLAHEEEGDRAAIGRTVMAGADDPHSFDDIQHLAGVMKKAGVDPKEAGAVLAASMPLLKQNSQEAVKYAQLAEKQNVDEARIDRMGAQTTLGENKLVLDQQKYEHKKEQDSIVNSFKERALSQVDQKIMQKNVELAQAKASKDEAAAERIYKDMNNIIEGASKEAQAMVAAQNIEDEGQKKAVMDGIMSSMEARRQAVEAYKTMPSPQMPQAQAQAPAPAPAPQQGAEQKGNMGTGFAPAPPQAQPQQVDIDYLNKNPGVAADFDERFGKDASKKFLRQ